MSKIEYTNFRDIEIKFNLHFNCIIGINESGKTELLEQICKENIKTTNIVAFYQNTRNLSVIHEKIQLINSIAFYYELHDKITQESTYEKMDRIILIDELELHLHPCYQKQIVGQLKENFPNTQFIVTTHSPFIIQSLNLNELITIDKRDWDKILVKGANNFFI